MTADDRVRLVARTRLRRSPDRGHSRLSSRRPGQPRCPRRHHGGLSMPDTLELRPLGEALGTEALGVDLSRLDDETFARISRAFAEHPVLVFRDQKLCAADIAAFGRRFGVPLNHSLVAYRHPDHPEVSWLRNVAETGEDD